ncbi:MAG TPA: hypothetical protein PK871_09805 [Mycobacterium sp.]|nr:hypothetical protein [Mycobacterium sp.]
MRIVSRILRRQDAAELAADAESPQSLAIDPKLRADYRRRIAVIAAVSLVPWAMPVFGVVSDVIAGSRSVFVVVVPILAWLLVIGFIPPRGVVDNEVDWIVSTLVCVTAAVAIVLFTYRIPTLTQLWRIELVGPVVWLAAATGIFLGVRYAAQLWDLWLLLLFFTGPLPFLLILSPTGGSDLAVAALACGLATLVVLRVLRGCQLKWFLGGTALSVAVGGSAAWLAIVALPDRELGLLAAVTVGAGVVPGITAYTVLSHAPRIARAELAIPPAKLPSLSRWGVVTLAVLSVMTLVIFPLPPSRPTLLRAADDWTQRSGLEAVRNYGAAAKLLGPHASVTRYVSSRPSSPPSAVDVISAPTRGILDDFVDAQWYASPEPVDYVPADLAAATDLEVRSAHSNADNAVDPTAPQWYLLTWMWQVGSGFQQVIVVVSQHDEGRLPIPSGVSLPQVLLTPMLWIARQQPKQRSEVASQTVDQAKQLAHRLIGAAGLAGSAGGRLT